MLFYTDKYLKTGDLWEQMNIELELSTKENIENKTREDKWAYTFVRTVLESRQKDFNNAWNNFPMALSYFNEKNLFKKNGNRENYSTVLGIQTREYYCFEQC
jgi:hypothetical protein